MTKSELKGIIMECIDELQLESVDEDQAIIESCELIEEACFNMLNEAMEEFLNEAVDPKIKGNYDASRKAHPELKAADALKIVKGESKELANSIKTTNREEAKQSALKKVASKLGGGFKVVGDKIVSVYTGKDGKGKQIAAIAATATAVAATIAATAVAINKKKKDKQDKENNEENKED